MFGQRTKSVDPNQGTWTFTYDGSGQLLSQTDARNIATTFVYDSLGRMTSRRSTQNGAQGAVLDACQNSEETLDTWAYNDAFAPLGTIESLSREIKKNYDACNGQPVRTTTATPWKESYLYDNASRVEKITTSIIEVDGQTAQPFVTDVQYDQTYNREKVRRYPSGLRVQSTYTVYGGAHRMRDADLQQDYLTIDRRDHWGNITQQTYGNFTAGLFTSNPGTGQSQQRLWKNGGPNGVEVDRFDYTYDVFGNLGSQTRSYPGAGTIPGSSRTETYTYDNLHRLTRAFSGTSEPIYGAVDYAYDDVGNLLAKTDYSDALGSGPSTPYQYTSGKPNAVTSVTRNGVPLNYSYDANGNMTGGAIQGAYDPQNLPRKLVRNGSTILFDYTPNGDRYRERKAGFPAKLILPNGLERLSDRNYQHELGEVSVRRDQYGQTEYESTNKVYYNYQDRLGSTSTMADGNGVVLPRGRMVFDAFGMAREANFMARYRVGPEDATAGSLMLDGITDRGFTGHQHLDTLQLIHMNGRAYDFRLGRFLSVDPIIQFPANSQSLNPYSYILNNPLSGTDPTGYATSCGDVDVSESGSGTCEFTNKEGKTSTVAYAVSSGKVALGAANNLGVVKYAVRDSFTGPVTVPLSVGSNNEPVYGCSACSGVSKQSTTPASQTDQSKGGAADTEGVSARTPGQEASQRVVDITKTGARGVLTASEYILPQNETELALSMGLGSLGKLLKAAGPGTNAALLRNMENLSDEIKVVTAGPSGIKLIKAANLPNWRTISIDMTHVISGHTPTGARIMPDSNKTFFPTTMSDRDIERAIRQAYRYGERVRSQEQGGQTRVLMRGYANNTPIMMWVNVTLKKIESAYPPE